MDGEHLSFDGARAPRFWPSGDLALAVAVQEVKRPAPAPDARRTRTHERQVATLARGGGALLWNYYLKQAAPDRMRKKDVMLRA